MRSIDIDTDVFALIWANRISGEDTESDILLRILNEYRLLKRSLAKTSYRESSHHLSVHGPPLTRKTPKVQKEVNRSNSTPGDSNEHAESAIGKIRWVDDVRDALRNLGGSASLHEIYKEVEHRRRNGNRSVPKTLDAIVRRTLEEHSTDSLNFERNLSSPDLFANISRGEWALRKQPALNGNRNRETQNRSMQMINDSELKPLPTEGEVMAELEDYLSRIGRPIRPTEAYKELGNCFGLTDEQRNRQMPNSNEVHWENRIRFAKRKLKDSGKLDPDQPHGWWAIKPTH